MIQLFSFKIIIKYYFYGLAVSFYFTLSLKEHLIVLSEKFQIVKSRLMDIFLFSNASKFELG